jgi:hypothetical protein
LCNPIDTAIMVSKISDSDTIVTGYTLYSYIQLVSIEHDNEINLTNDKLVTFREYLVPGFVSISGKEKWMKKMADSGAKRVYIYRWFDKDASYSNRLFPVSSDKNQRISPVGSSDIHFVKVKDMKKTSLRTLEDAETLRNECDYPGTVTARFVTIENVYAIGNEQKRSR